MKAMLAVEEAEMSRSMFGMSIEKGAPAVL